MQTTELDPESVVISGLCKSPESRKQFLDKVSKDDFNIRSYGKVFEAITTLAQSGHTISMDTILSFFTETMDRMQITFLFDTKVSSEITPEIFKAFKKSGARARQVKLRDTIDRELKKGTDPDSLNESIRGQVAVLDGEADCLEVIAPDTAVDSAVWLLDQWAQGDRPVVSGLPELDDKLFLSQFIGYWVIAGNSGVGKSAFMCNIAKENGRKGIPGVICSLEMSKELLLIRMAMEDPKVRGLELTEQTIKNQQKMSDLKYAMNQFRRMPVHIIEGTKNIFQLDRQVRATSVTYGAKWLVFDYIQLGHTKPTDSDVVRVYTVSRYLQGLTKPDLPNGFNGMQVIALSQYNNESTKSKNDQVTLEANDMGRPIPQRKPPRPSNSDLAWSGQIKQDADGIIHIYPVGDVNSPIVDLELHCGKQRNYKSGWTVQAQFIKAEQKFVTPLSRKMALSPGDITRPSEVRKVTF